MSLLPTVGAIDQSTGFYNSVATQSLRSQTSEGTTLSKTLGTPTTRRRWTISFWIKRTALGDGVNATNSYNPLMGCDNKLIARFDINDKFQLYDYDGNFDVNLVSTMVFRDTSAWYNIVVVADIDGQSGNNRMKLYVNGVRKDWSGDDPGDYDPRWNGALAHQLLADGQTSAKFNGYVSDITFLDGQAIGETSGYLNEFGEVKEGIWIPKKYSGSYGNNGFRLEFKGTGTATSSGAVTNPTNVGDDSSGQNNHFAVSGLDSHDSNLLDSPENNFATMDILSFPLTTDNIGEGNLRTGQTDQSVHASIFGIPTSGKWYWEVNTVSSNGSNYYMPYVGVCTTSLFHTEQNVSGSAGDTLHTKSGYSHIRGNDAKYKNLTGTSLSDGANSSDEGSASGEQGIAGFALDVDAGTIKYYWNNSLVRTDTTLTAGDEFFVLTVATNSGGNLWNFNYFNFGVDSSFAGTKTAQGKKDGNGNGDFYYSPPSGHLALCTDNLDEPTIGPNSDTQANDHFGSLTYTSNGSGVNIVSGGNDNNGTAIGGDISFTPDFVWIKRRNGAGGHMLQDSTRGSTKRLRSDTNDQEITTSTAVTSFDTNGFTLGTEGGVNTNGGTYVSWNWLANGTTTTTNDASATGVGSIDSVHQANTTAGFSIVTYTGSSSGNNGTDSTVAHGLNATPKWIFFLPRDTYDGCVYHAGISSDAEDKKLILKASTYADSSTAATDDDSFFDDTPPDDNVFSIGSRKHSNSNGGMVAYCWAEVLGYSKFSFFEGTGNSEGTFVYTGFRPAWVMFKNVDATAAWIMQDTTRDPHNVATAAVVANNTYSESTVAARNIDFLSNGFKLRTTAGDTNGNGQRIVYMAFAEAPFKYANAR
tara:strand:+ start:485 stop:3085 length:2601 start_codon:yes stop_codon:yes gene_type:complete